MTQEQRIEYFMSEIARLSNQVVDLQDERDAFAIRLEDSEEQYSELHNKNSALAAQVEALTKTIIEAKIVYEEFSLFVWKSFVLEITNSARVCNRRDTYEMLDKKFQSVIPDGYVTAAPQQHLAEIRADAGRAGFIAGYLLCNDGSPLIKHNYEGFANQYAESIRQEVK